MRRSTNREICGNCEYWNGEREPVFDKNGIPKNNIITKRGICMKIGSKFTDQLRVEDLSCKFFSKWTEIL